MSRILPTRLSRLSLHLSGHPRFPRYSFHASIKMQMHLLPPESQLAFTRDFWEAKALWFGLGGSPECCSAEAGLDQWPLKALSTEAKSPAWEGGCVSPNGPDGGPDKLGTLPEMRMWDSHTSAHRTNFNFRAKSWREPFLSERCSGGVPNAGGETLSFPVIFSGASCLPVVPLAPDTGSSRGSHSGLHHRWPLTLPSC